MRYNKCMFIIALIAITCLSVFSCSVSKEDPVDDTGTGIGVHHIDVHFATDKKAGINTFCTFKATAPDGKTVQLYENRKKVSESADSKRWNVEDMRDLSVDSENGCSSMELNIQINGKDMVPLTSDVTVTIVGYVNNKRIKSQVETIPAGMKLMKIEFNTGHKEIHNALLI